jgi:predicted dehydrogenase
MSNLLIGCGSVGKRHLAKLVELDQSLWVIDPSEDARNYAISKSNLVLQTYNSLDEFMDGNNDANINSVIIANWGPDHFATIDKVRKLQPRKILIEKPVASKLSDLYKIKNLLPIAKESNFVNFHIRFDSGFEKLVEICDETFLGIPLVINVIGGAKCISTTGIHWLDFSNQILKSKWKNINSIIEADRINPRSPDLNFLQGYSQIVYENGSSVSINFTNKSYMDTQLTLIWKSAKGVLVNGELIIYGPSEELKMDRPINRTIFFDKEIMRIQFFKDGFENLYDEYNKSDKIIMENFISANEILLLSLISSRMNQPITPKSRIKKSALNLDWKIS